MKKTRRQKCVSFSIQFLEFLYRFRIFGNLVKYSKRLNGYALSNIRAEILNTYLNKFTSNIFILKLIFTPIEKLPTKHFI